MIDNKVIGASLKKRIEEIEKQNRRLKNYMKVMVLAFLSLAFIGAKAGPHNGEFNQITAKILTIVDDAGRERIVLGSNEEGTGLKVINMEGKKLLGVGIAAGDRGSGISFSDKEGRPRIGLGLDEGIPGMAIINENGRKIIGIGGDDRGYGLSIMDGDEVERAAIGFQKGSTGVVLYDDEGQFVRGMTRQKDGVHYFSYMDDKGDMMVVE